MIANLPKTVSVATNNKPSEFQVSFTDNDLHDLISISEFSIVPSGQERRTVSNENSRSTVKSFRIAPKKFYSTKLHAIQTDEHMQKYMQETRNARDARRKLRLPPIQQQQQFQRRPSIGFGKWHPLHNFLFDRLIKIEEKDEIGRYEPTYQLGPKTKFDSRRAQPLIQELLSNFISVINVEQVMSSQSSIKTALDNLCTRSEQHTFIYKFFKLRERERTFILIF